MRSSNPAIVEPWARLRRGMPTHSGHEIPTLPSSVDTGFGPVRYALGPANEARLLLPMTSRERIPEIAPASALSIGEATYVLDSSPRRFLELTCREPHLDPIFGEIAQSIQARISLGETSAEACRTTIEDFRSLLAQPARPSAETVRGLLGELLVLDRLLEFSPRGWQCWRGPLRDRHDFRSGTTSIEVKTGSRRGTELIRISSLDQMLPPETGELFLFHCKLEQSKGGALTVGELARSCCDRSNSPERVLELLSAMECDPSAAGWNESEFNLEGLRMYRIGPGFPCLTFESFKGDVPAGISSIEYCIDLAHARSFALDDHAAHETFRRMAECLPD